MAQLVKHLTLDFGSGHDLRVVQWSPMLGSVLGEEWSLFKILFSPLSLLLPLPLQKREREGKDMQRLLQQHTY